jgi:uncharacterized protein YjbI with pentapeptide repeats
MSTWERCWFDGVDLTGADFTGADLTGAGLVGCRLVDVELSKATLQGARLHGSVLDAVRGGDSLRGTVIGSDQIVPVAVPLFAALGITVDDAAAEERESPHS